MNNEKLNESDTSKLDSHIRIANLQDAAAIAEIYNESIAIGDASMDREWKDAAYYITLMQKMTERESYFILEKEARVLGWAVIKAWSDRYGYRFTAETSVFLRRDENVLSKGYGKALMQHTLLQAKTWQYHHLIARIGSTNERSIRFHQTLGYEIVGVQKEVGFLDDTWHDVTILQKIL